MADSPVYEPQVAPQVQPSAELPATARPETFGAGMGAAMENAAEIATRYHHEAYQQANQTAALDHNNALEQWGQKNVYDPQNGVLAKPSGKNAPAVADQTLKSFDDFASKQMEGAANEDQRITFQRINQQKRAELERHLGAYEHAQVTQYQDQTDEAAIANAATSAAHNAYDGEHVQDQIGKMQAVIADRGARKGVAPELVKVQQQEAASGTHLSVMEQMSLDGNNAAASQYFHAHQDDLVGADLLKAKRMVEEGNTQDQGLAIARFIINDRKFADPNDPNSSAPLNREEALAALDARGITNARIYDEARRQIDTHYDLANKAHAETQSTLLQQGADALDDPNNTQRSIPPTILAGLDLKNRRALQAYQQQKIKDAEPKTDPDVWRDITDRLRTPELMKAATTPGDSLYVDLNLHRADLSPTDYKHLANEFDTTKAKVAANDQRWSMGTIQKDVQDELFKQAGLDQKVKQGSDAEKAQSSMRGLFSMQLQKAVAARQLAEQRALTRPEIQEEAEKLFTKKTWQVPTHGLASFGNFTGLNELVGGRGSSSAPFTSSESGPGYQAPWAKDLVYDESQIPADMLKTMIQSEQKSGITKTGEGRVRQYNDMVKARYLASLNTP